MNTKGVITQEEVKVYLIINLIMLIIGSIVIFAAIYIIWPISDTIGFFTLIVSLIIAIEGGIGVLSYFIYPGFLMWTLNRLKYKRLKRERSQ